MKPAPSLPAGLPGVAHGCPTGHSVAADPAAVTVSSRRQEPPIRISSAAFAAASRMPRSASADAQPSSEGRSPVRTQLRPFRSGMARYGHRLAMSPTHGSASVTGEPLAAPCGRGLLRTVSSSEVRSWESLAGPTPRPIRPWRGALPRQSPKATASMNPAVAGVAGVRAVAAYQPASKRFAARFLRTVRGSQMRPFIAM